MGRYFTNTEHVTDSPTSSNSDSTASATETSSSTRQKRVPYANIRYTRTKSGNSSPRKAAKAKANKGHKAAARKAAAAETQDEIDLDTMTAEQITAYTTRHALQNLPAPPTTPTWSEEHKEVLTDTLKRLAEATADHTEMINDEKAEEFAESRASEDRGRPLVGFEGSGKRPRESSAAPSHRAQSPNEHQDKKPRQSEEEEPNYMDLYTLKPQPVRERYEAHGEQESPDSWFVESFEGLYNEIVGFFNQYFGLEDLSEDAQPWAAQLGDPFLSYAQQVAEADPNGGSWDAILRDVNQRNSLLVGILWTVLEKKIFDELLFGGLNEEKELLFNLDNALLDSEGFARTELRQKTVRTILSGAATTSNFYPDVAHLTAQVSLLFQPLLIFLDANSEAETPSRGHFWEQHQKLHDVISRAAYLSLCIRVSPSIFYFTALRPGDAHQRDDTFAIHPEIYEASRETKLLNFNTGLESWTAHKAVLQEHAASLSPPAGQAAGRKEKRLITQAEKDLAIHESLKPHPAYNFRALTKIAVWPNIRRFKPGRGDDPIGTPLVHMRGFRIFEVAKSIAVEYYGVDDLRERYASRIDLGLFVRGKREEFGEKEVVNVAKYVAIATVLASFPVIASMYTWGHLAPGLLETAGEFAGNSLQTVGNLAGSSLQTAYADSLQMAGFVRDGLVNAIGAGPLGGGVVV